MSLNSWRKISVKRYEDPELVEICREANCREVFDYHARICDLIEINRANLVEVSLFTLARQIHDDAGANEIEWMDSRGGALEGLRAKGLVVFDGEISLHMKLAISLPEETYNKWFDDRAKKSEAAKTRPRSKTGTFMPSTKHPHEQAVSSCGTTSDSVEPHSRPVEPHSPLDLDLDLNKNPPLPPSRSNDNEQAAVILAPHIGGIDRAREVIERTEFMVMGEPWVLVDAATEYAKHVEAGKRVLSPDRLYASMAQRLATKPRQDKPLSTEQMLDAAGYAIRVHPDDQVTA